MSASPCPYSIKMYAMIVTIETPKRKVFNRKNAKQCQPQFE